MFGIVPSFAHCVHRERMNCKTLKGNLIIILTTELDKRIFNFTVSTRKSTGRSWSDVRTGGLRRRRLPGKSGPFRAWRGGQRGRRWSGAHREGGRETRHTK